MGLQETIKNGIKDAMKSKDAVRLATYRALVSAMMNEAVAKGGTPQDALIDEDAMTVIMRIAKQRKDAIEQFTTAGRDDLADEDKAQLAIIQEFLPAQMNADEIKTVLARLQTELGITDVSKKNMLLGTAMKELKGKADGAVVKEIVDQMFT